MKGLRAPIFLFSLIVGLCMHYGAQERKQEKHGAQYHKVEVKIASFECVDGWEAVYYEPIKAMVYLSPKDAISPLKIAEAKVHLFHFPGDPPRSLAFTEYEVAITLASDSVQQMAALTDKYLNGYMAVLLDGRILCIPLINQRIVQGELRLDCQWSPEQAASVAQQLSPTGKA